MRKWIIKIVVILLMMVLLSSMAMAGTYLSPFDVIIAVEGGMNPTDGQLYDHSFINGATITRTVIGSDYFIYAEPNLVLDELNFTYKDLNNQTSGYTYSIQWSSSNEKVATINARNSNIFTKVEGSAVSVRAVSNGTARITALTTVEYWYSPTEQHKTKTVESYFDIVVAGTESGSPQPGSSADPVSAETEIPPIDIADYGGNILTNQTWDLALDKSVRLAVALDASIWQKTTKTAGNTEISGYFSQDSLGNYYYFLVDSVQWEITGTTACVYAGDASGGSVTLTAKDAGSVVLTAAIPCGYLVSSGRDLVDHGIVGTAFAATVVQVKKSGYENPFDDINVAEVENPFIDVSPDDWYYEYAVKLCYLGMMNGVDVSASADGTQVFVASAVDDGLGVQGALVNGNLMGSSLWANIAAGKVDDIISSASSSGSSGSASAAISFNGSAKESRGNTVIVMYNGHKAIGGSVGSYTSNPFTDVASSKTYYQPVLWAAANSIVNGYGNGKFGPVDGITREQFCAILVRYAKDAGITLPAEAKSKTFTDASKISNYAKSAVTACQKAGIINGYPDGSFRPQASISRAEVAKMICEFFSAVS